jgi:LysW-gamma-L-lysine/LysW-L-ornithine aminotransferase
MSTLVEPTTIREREVQYASGVYAKRDLTVVRGEGAWVWDDRGRRYIDGTGGYGTANLGHAHPVVANAIADQARTLVACPELFANDRRAELLERLADIVPAGLDRFFLCNSGTEAVESALKIARASTGRTEIVATRGGFHGRTMGALSATWEPHYRDSFVPLVPDFRHVPYNKIETLEAAVSENTAAVILEPVQGEGGVRPADAEYLRVAAELCNRVGALLILDEIQTGFGRTGRMFACEHSGVTPDLMCLAKSMGNGVPIGAAAIGPRVGTLGVGIHGSTFGGNPLTCAAAAATIGVLRDGAVIARGAIAGERLLSGLRAISNPRIREVRGMGLMVGVELRERVRPTLQALQAQGVLALQAGPTTVRFLPPLVISDQQVDMIIAAMAQVLEAGTERADG